MNITPVEAARRLADLQARIAELTQQADEYKHIILSSTPIGETIEIDGQPVYRVQAGARRYNEQQARTNLPADLIATATVTREAIDPKKLKSLVPPALWELATVQGDPVLKAV